MASSRQYGNAVLGVHHQEEVYMSVCLCVSVDTRDVVLVLVLEVTVLETCLVNTHASQLSAASMCHAAVMSYCTRNTPG